MHVLIAGGSGLIGRALSLALVRNGHRVTVLTRSPQQAAGRLPAGVTAHPWDARTLEGWAHLVAQAEGIVNLAGENIAGENLRTILTRRWTPEVKARIRASRLRAGDLLTRAVQQAEKRPAVLVQASAVGYYGPAGDQEVVEDSPPGDDFGARLCLEWEASTAGVEELGVRRVVIRTGLVLAREGGILPVMLLPVRFFLGGPLGNGRQAVPWIHLADEAAAIRFLLENETAQGPYNLTAPHPVSQAELVRIAARILRRPALLPTPAFLLQLLLGEKATLVLDGQRALPRRLREAGFCFRYEYLEAALQDLCGEGRPGEADRE